MNIPADWFSMDNTTVPENQQVYSFNEQQAEKILQLNKDIVRLLSISKRDIKTSEGIMPTIKINVRNTATTSLEQLKINMQASIEQTMHSFTGFKYLTPFEITKTNKIPAVSATIYYLLPVEDKLIPVRTFMYFFLCKGYFIQASFSDLGEKEDEKEYFSNLIKTISLESETVKK